MKKRFTLLFVGAFLTMALALTAACSAPSTESNEADTATAEASSLPALEPADHEGRFESGGGDMCYTCHGNGHSGNPNTPNAVAIPEDHYVDGSYDTKEIDPNRMQCITCHPVAEK